MHVLSLTRFRPYLRLLVLVGLLAFLGLVLPRLLGRMGDLLFPPGQVGADGRPLGLWDILSQWLLWLLQQLRGFMEGARSTGSVSIIEGFGELC
ncbi:MAG: hypothetical protein RDU89_00890 [bacterium]|nr:hypothetical protein [bacterium]